MTDADRERAVCGAKLLGCQPTVISIGMKMEATRKYKEIDGRERKQMEPEDEREK